MINIYINDACYNLLGLEFHNPVIVAVKGAEFPIRNSFSNLRVNMSGC